MAEVADAVLLKYDHTTWFEIAETWYTKWESAHPGETAAQFFAKRHAPILGQHYFITNPITHSGISPKWDFSAKGDRFHGNPNAYIVASKVEDLPAPTGPGDVDWLQLKEVTGKLADEVYRVDTRGGQPPAACVKGKDTISVKYAAIYCKLSTPSAH